MLNYLLKMTSSAFPEQYDVFLNDTQVGYLRLRHGYYYVSFPDCCDDIIYEAYPDGDGFFMSEERVKYLDDSVDAIHKKLGNTGLFSYIVDFDSNEPASEFINIMIKQ